MSQFDQEVFVREIALLGADGFAKLTKANVAVCGVGGVGSYLAEALARAGIGKLIIIDFDQVTKSNINRQLYALHSTLGQDKAELAARRINDINPECQVEVKKIFLDEHTDYNELFADIDYIADAIDYVNGKVAMIKFAKSNDIPIISSMGTGRRLDPTRMAIADISKTYNCPLAKSIRHQLKQIGIYKGVNVLFSDELPIKSDEDFISSISFVPSVAGLIMASKIVKDIGEING
jgi:tRNA threonylcarbamoyladenosine dehydratase